MGKLSAFIFCFLFLYTFGYSQLTFRRLSVQEGISNSSVIAITQDNDHFLWFGTRDGLNRFDGYNIQIFRKDRGNPNSLLFDDIRLLYFDPQLKTIWAGSTKGLSRFISEKMNSITFISIQQKLMIFQNIIYRLYLETIRVIYGLVFLMAYICSMQ